MARSLAGITHGIANTGIGTLGPLTCTEGGIGVTEFGHVQRQHLQAIDKRGYRWLHLVVGPLLKS
jgi:hypothetical protein